MYRQGFALVFESGSGAPARPLLLSQIVPTAAIRLGSYFGRRCHAARHSIGAPAFVVTAVRR